MFQQRVLLLVRSIAAELRLKPSHMIYQTLTGMEEESLGHRGNYIEIY